MIHDKKLFDVLDTQGDAFKAALADVKKAQPQSQQDGPQKADVDLVAPVTPDPADGVKKLDQATAATALADMVARLEHSANGATTSPKTVPSSPKTETDIGLVAPVTPDPADGVKKLDQATAATALADMVARLDHSVNGATADKPGLIKQYDALLQQRDTTEAQQIIEAKQAKITEELEKLDVVMPSLAALAQTKKLDVRYQELNTADEKGKVLAMLKLSSDELHVYKYSGSSTDNGDSAVITSYLVTDDKGNVKAGYAGYEKNRGGDKFYESYVKDLGNNTLEAININENGTVKEPMKSTVVHLDGDPAQKKLNPNVLLSFTTGFDDNKQNITYSKQELLSNSDELQKLNAQIAAFEKSNPEVVAKYQKDHSADPAKEVVIPAIPPTPPEADKAEPAAQPFKASDEQNAIATRLGIVFGKPVSPIQNTDKDAVFEIEIGNQDKEQVAKNLIEARRKAGLDVSDTAKEILFDYGAPGKIAVFLPHPEGKLTGADEKTLSALEAHQNDFQAAFTASNAPKEPVKTDKPAAQPASALDTLLGSGVQPRYNTSENKLIEYNFQGTPPRFTVDQVKQLVGELNKLPGMEGAFLIGTSDGKEEHEVEAILVDPSKLSKANLDKLGSIQPAQPQQSPTGPGTAPPAGAAPGTNPPGANPAPTDPGMFTTGGVIGMLGTAVLGYLGLSGLTGGFSSITSSIMTVLAVGAAAVAGLFAGKWVESTYFKQPTTGPDADAVTVKTQPQKTTSADYTLALTQGGKDYTLTGKLDDAAHKLTAASVTDATGKTATFNQAEVLQLNAQNQIDEKDQAAQTQLKAILADARNKDKVAGQQPVALTPAVHPSELTAGMKLPGLTYKDHPSTEPFNPGSLGASSGASGLGAG